MQQRLIIVATGRTRYRGSAIGALQKADGYGINRAITRSQNSAPSKPPKIVAMNGYLFEVFDERTGKRRRHSKRPAQGDT